MGAAAHEALTYARDTAGCMQGLAPSPHVARSVGTKLSRPGRRPCCQGQGLEQTASTRASSRVAGAHPGTRQEWRWHRECPKMQPCVSGPLRAVGGGQPGEKPVLARGPELGQRTPPLPWGGSHAVAQEACVSHTSSFSDEEKNSLL